MYHFVLVHGTFAEHAPWTLEGSALRARITESVKHSGQVTFAPVPWGGRNLTRARVTAASAIAAEVEKNCANDEKIFLIGHSHGGSAIAYCLKVYPHIRERVTGVAFLSTPFIATRLRPQWQLLLHALIVSFILMLLLLVFFAVMWVDWNIRIKSGYWTRTSDLIFYPLAMAAGLFFAYRAWRYVERRLSTYLEHELPEALNRLATVNMPRGDHLYLRAMGDEAAGLLSMAHLFSWLMSIVGAIASLPIQKVGDLWRKVVSTWWGKGVATIAALLFGFWVCTRLAMTNISFAFCGMFSVGGRTDCGILRNLRYWLPGPTNLNGYPDLKWLLEPVDLVVHPLSWLFLPTLVIFIGYLALTIVLAAMSAIMWALFGWIGLGPALFADLAVEPTPDGPITLVHVDWRAEQAQFILSLNHSRTYSNPVALDHLVNWINSTAKAANGILEERSSNSPVWQLPA